MAQYLGKNATKRYAVPSEKVTVKEQGGRMRVAHDVMDLTVVGATALVLNDTVVMGQIPKNGKLLDVWIDVADAFTAGTINIGWSASQNGDEAANATGIVAAQVLTATGRFRMAASAAGFLKEFADAVDIVMTAPGAVSADGILSVTAIYMLD